MINEPPCRQVLILKVIDFNIAFLCNVMIEASLRFREICMKYRLSVLALGANSKVSKSILLIVAGGSLIHAFVLSLFFSADNYEDKYGHHWIRGRIDDV